MHLSVRKTSMDIERKDLARGRRRRRIIYAVVGLGIVVAIGLGVKRLEPAAPTVEQATVWIDTVKRGEMLRQVRGLGTLVPEEIRWIAAVTDGRVERILVKPGAAVKAETVLIELTNPELEQAALDAQMQLKSAEAEYISLRLRLENQRLDLQSSIAKVESDHHQAKLRADTDEELSKRGLIAELNVKLSRTTAEELEKRSQIEQKRLAISTESEKAQLAVQQAHVDQLRALYRLKRSQVDSLQVRSGTEGVLQQLPVEVGQRMVPGTTLAKIAEPKRLKAELKIAETQAKDIQIGQEASIDTRNGIIPGKVIRIDPAVQNGTVTVDVALEGVLPKRARPDLSVEGTIELERLENVLYVGRPVHGQERSNIGLFKIVDMNKTAARVQVKLGRSSVSTIEILEGLDAGDQVILSDMSAWDSFDRVRLK